MLLVGGRKSPSVVYICAHQKALLTAANPRCTSNGKESEELALSLSYKRELFVPSGTTAEVERRGFSGDDCHWCELNAHREEAQCTSIDSAVCYVAKTCQLPM
jgi:hypothetical protein